jgi:hypothetical protein
MRTLASHHSERLPVLSNLRPATQLLRCQYLYVCTSKASKLRTLIVEAVRHLVTQYSACQQQQRQYLYFCASTARKLGTAPSCASQRGTPSSSSSVSICTFVPVKQVN